MTNRINCEPDIRDELPEHAEIAFDCLPVALPAILGERLPGIFLTFQAGILHQLLEFADLAPKLGNLEQKSAIKPVNEIFCSRNHTS